MPLTLTEEYKIVSILKFSHTSRILQLNNTAVSEATAFSVFQKNTFRIFVHFQLPPTTYCQKKLWVFFSLHCLWIQAKKNPKFTRDFGQLLHKFFSQRGTGKILGLERKPKQASGPDCFWSQHELEFIKGKKKEETSYF